MRISARGRYALAATISMAARYETGENITVVSLSENLSISKIYLEQVFSLLKKADVVSSQKGAQGGYRLTQPPHNITAFDVLWATDLSLFEDVGDTVKGKAPGIEAAMRQKVFDTVDRAVRETLSAVTLQDLAEEMKNNCKNQGYMFFI